VAAEEAVPDGGGGLISGAELGTIGNLVRDQRLRKAIAVAIAGRSVYQAARGHWQRHQVARAYKITVSGDDPVYADLHAWLLDQLSGNVRSVEVSTTRRNSGDGSVPASYDDPDSVTSPASGGRYVGSGKKGSRGGAVLRQAYTDAISQEVHLDGHTIQVSVEQDSLGEMTAKERAKWGAVLAATQRIRFQAQGIDGRNAVLSLIQRLGDARMAGGAVIPSLSVAAPYGGWDTRADLPERPLDTVVLPDDQRDDIVDDLQRFLDDEDLHASLGAPWHRGYLLFGPPGGGKTSLVRALSSHFGLDLFWIPLDAMEDDSALTRAVSSIRARSILLLEDVDVYGATVGRESAEKGQATLSGLLQALDGVSTPHGLVTVMTTNLDLDDDASPGLPEALTRSGRIDRHFRIDHVTNAQVDAMVERFTTGDQGPWTPYADGRTVEVLGTGPHTLGFTGLEVPASDVIEVIKTYRADRTKVLDGLDGVVARRSWAQRCGEAASL
jgi:hypothetical protein